MSATDATRAQGNLADTAPRWWVTTFAGHRAVREGSGRALKIETLAGPELPSAGAGSLEVVFDGFLYNRAEVAGLAGCAPGGTDAEVVLAAYRRWGTELVDRIAGRFALIVWDGERQELICIRDPLGCYPLFWAARGDEILLSTGIDELIGKPGVSGAFNRVLLAEHLCCRWTRPEDTYYAAVQRVRPGHVMTVADHGRRRSYRYWDPVPTPDSNDWVPEDELVRFDGLFEQAIDRCLVSEQAGIYLSGGLDSVSVAAVAADLSRAHGAPPPIALSVAFPEPDYSEETVQRSVATQLGMPQVMVSYDAAVTPPGRLAAAVEGSAGMPVPLLGLWVPAYWHIASQGRERGCGVILTGGGGDEMLIASPSLAADFIRRGDVRSLWELFRSLQRSYPWTHAQLAKSVLWRTGARALLVDAARKGLGVLAPGPLDARWRRQIAEGTPAWVRPEPEITREMEDRALELATKPTRLSDYYYEDNRFALDHVAATIEMEKVFEEGRRVGVRILEPFWDADLQEFLYRVPPLLLHEGGHTKSLVRGMLGRRFPELGFERQKKKLADELSNEIMTTEGPQLLRDMGGTRVLSELGLVDQAPLEEWLTRMVSDTDERRRSYLLWHVLALEAWVRPRA